MIIDTDRISDFIKIHSRICVPIAVGFLSWYAALRWQVAIEHSQLAMQIFYFFVTAVSGVTTVVLTIKHLTRCGFFKR